MNNKEEPRRAHTKTFTSETEANSTKLPIGQVQLRPLRDKQMSKKGQKTKKQKENQRDRT